jgi:hypothetical protein
MAKLRRDYGQLGYNPTAKAAFLEHARKYLKAVGNVLKKDFGYTDVDVRTSEGGIAVSGDVYLEAYAPDKARGVYVWIAESCVSSGEDRRDHVTVMYRRVDGSGRSGRNIWGKTSMDSTALAVELDRLGRTEFVAF